MRKQFPILIGIIALLWTGNAHASCTSLDPILSFPAVSTHYTERVRNRANDAISRAGSLSVSPWTTYFFTEWRPRIRAAMQETLHAEIIFAEEAEAIVTRTACLDVDLRIIRALMEKTWCAMQGGFQDNSIPAIIQMYNLHRFLNQRYKELLIGSVDPFYADRGWHMYQVFDNDDFRWCCVLFANEANRFTCQNLTVQQCFANGGLETYDTQEACLTSGFPCTRLVGTPVDDDQRLCPFHSDYLPATSNGFGCSAEIMSAYAGLEPTNSEFEAYDRLEEVRQEFVDNAEPIKDLRIQLDQLTGRTPPDLSEFGQFGQDHKTFFGCGEQLIEEWDIAPDDPPDGVGTGRTITNLIALTGATTIPLRGPFSLDKNERQILIDYLRLRAVWGSNREAPDYLKERYEVTEPFTATGSFFDKSLARIVLGGSERSFLQVVSSEQGILESAVTAKASDMQYEIARALAPVRSTTRALSRLASERGEGLRKFGINFAWYLRRSCVHRPCNEQLERVLKILLANSCFPYTDGGISGENHEACESDAEL